MEEIEPITRKTKGAEFIKADLHVHTPKSYDVDEDITPEEFVEEFVENGIKLIAITDHNCSGWYEEVKEAAEGRPLTVLPGVEITTPQGSEHRVHLTAIFPPEKFTRINHLLSQIGINPEEDLEAEANDPLWSICDKILENDGIPILPHIDDVCGAHEEFDRDTSVKDRIFDEEKIKAIGITKEETEEMDEYSNFPKIRCSDAHSLEDIGEDYTFMKMTEPSFEGVRTALTDPQSRIKLDEYLSEHSVVKGIRIDSDFFEDKSTQLNRNLNCLIGGKGTGKSALIEHLRHAFKEPYRNERIEEEQRELLEATLGEDGFVEVQIETDEGGSYSIRRAFREDPEIIKDDGTKLPISINEFKNEYFDLEIYSQGELLEISRDIKSQLDIIDSYLDLKELKDRRDKIKQNLHQNHNNISQKKNKVEEYEEKLTDLEILKENIRLMEEKGVDEYIEGEEKWEKEKLQLENMLEDISNMIEELGKISIDQGEYLEENYEEFPNSDLIENAKDKFLEIQQNVQSTIEKVIENLEEQKEAVTNIKEEWEERYEERNQELEQISEDIKEEINVDINDYLDQKAKVSELEKVEEEKEKLESNIDELEDKREEMFEDLKDTRDEIHTKRLEGIEEINENLTEVKVELERAGNREEYKEWLKDALTGSNVRRSDREKLADELDPRELASIIRSENVKQIEDIGLTETAAKNIVYHDSLRNELHQLEIQDIKDKPKIMLKVGNNWKVLFEMSEGQKCTALLSIALLERDKPLIIDQPEDMLDNKFIHSSVVKLIRKIKHNRQLIMATHNANIPVLGDAEQIIVMESHRNQGHLPYRGAIDDQRIKEEAQDILEGGREAFDRRRVKYGY